MWDVGISILDLSQGVIAVRGNFYTMQSENILTYILWCKIYHLFNDNFEEMYFATGI